jgi:hypothetical protein
VAENGKVSGRNQERNLGESGVERFDADDGVLLVVKPESAQQAVNFDIWVAWPDADVVTVLVVITGTFDVEFQVNAASFCADVEELTSDCDRSREGVLGVMDTFRPCQSTGGEFACQVFVSKLKGFGSERG